MIDLIYIILIVSTISVMFFFISNLLNDNKEEQRQISIKHKKNEISQDTYESIEVKEFNSFKEETQSKNYMLNDKIAKIVKECEAIGKTSFPLYRKGYETDYPVTDFSLFIKELIISNDSQTLIDFLEYYNQENFDEIKYPIESDINRIIKRYGLYILGKSGISISTNYTMNSNQFFSKRIRDVLKSNMTPLEYDYFYMTFQEEKGYSYKQVINQILKIDVEQYIESELNMHLDLKSFLSINFHYNTIDRRFCWTIYDTTGIVLFYSLGIYNYTAGTQITQLIDKYNFWLKWEKEENISFKEQEYIYKDSLVFDVYNPQTDLFEKIKTLGLGERFYFLYDYAYKNYIGTWDGSSSYITRSFGINEEDCFNKLKSMELLVEATDLRFVTDKLTKIELLDLAKSNGIELKKSWTKEKMYEYFIQNQIGKDLLKERLSQMGAVCLNKLYELDVVNLLHHIEKNRPIIQLLCVV